MADRQFAWLDLPLERRGELDPAASPPVSLDRGVRRQATPLGGPRGAHRGGKSTRAAAWCTVVARVDARNGGAEGADRLPPPVGLFVHAEIVGRSSGNVAVLPRSAVRDGNRVLVVDADRRLRFRAVEVVRIHGDNAYIGAGLDAGDRVCVSALQAAVDGMRVEIEGGPEGSGSGG